jgi:DNA-binding GntR family transcriptional regulator
MEQTKRNKTLLDDTYKKIKEMMFNNQLVPGQKIIYRDLAKKLNTSITPVVQTLKRLESANTVKYVPNVGYFVKETTGKEIKELYEAREALEVYALTKIIANITPEDISAIRSQFRDLDVSDPRMLGIHDAQFHLEIMKFSRNDIIVNLLKEIYEQIYLRYKPQLVGPQRPMEALKEHREILDALSKKNLSVARKIISKHIHLQAEHIAHLFDTSSYNSTI